METLLLFELELPDWSLRLMAVQQHLVTPSCSDPHKAEWEQGDPSSITGVRPQ